MIHNLDIRPANPAKICSIPPRRTLEEFERLIQDDIVGIKRNILSAGRHLLEAKAQHPRSFVRWLESGVAGLSKSSAYRLMEIAGSDIGTFPTLDNFPTETGALLELARLRMPQLSAAIESGDIKPGMHRRDAMALVDRLVPTYAARRVARKQKLADIAIVENGSDVRFHFSHKAALTLLEFLNDFQQSHSDLVDNRHVREVLTGFASCLSAAMDSPTEIVGSI